MTRKNETKGSHQENKRRGSSTRVWPLDVRMSIAKAVVEEGSSATRAAAAFGVPYTTALSWIERYRAGGASALQDTVRTSTGKRAQGVDARRAAILATREAQPHAGTRRIRDVMKRFLGIGTSETMVRRVLRSQGGEAARSPARPKPQRMTESHQNAKYAYFVYFYFPEALGEN